MTSVTTIMITSIVDTAFDVLSSAKASLEANNTINIVHNHIIININNMLSPTSPKRVSMMLPTSPKRVSMMPLV